MPRLPIAALLEQIHHLDDEEDVWLARLATHLLERLKGRSGVNAYRFERLGSGRYRSTRAPTAADCHTDLAEYDGSLPPGVAHAIYGTGTKAALAAPLLCGRDGRLLDFVADEWQRLRVNNTLGMVCDGGDGHGVALAVPLDARTCSAETLASMEHLAAHVASAMRLRRHLARADTPGERAWLDPDGTLLDVDGLRPTAELRARLRAGVRARETARDACWRDGEGELSAWTRLLGGAWSFLDFEERGGRRRVVALRNPDATRGLRALTELERQVTERAARGLASKQIALELDIAEPTVGNHLARALGKLGIPNRMILIQTRAAMAGAR